MTIAYDLRYAAERYVGIGTHAAALLEALLSLDGAERYAVIWNPDARPLVPSVLDVRRHPRVAWIETRDEPLGLGSLRRLGQLLRRVRASVYLSPFYLVPIGAPCPSIVTVHDVRPLRLTDGFGVRARVQFRAALWRTRHAHAVLTVSDFSAREAVELGVVHPARVHAVRSGVPASRGAGAPRRPSGAPEPPFALAVGSNRPHKNLATLAAAWAGFDDPPLALVCVGPEDRRHPSAAAVFDRAGARGVRTLGPVTPEELEWLYRSATLLLFPTRYEGFGFPLVEAFARGLPVIASDIPALREIGDGAARLVPATDAAAWRDAVRALASDESARGRLRDAGHRRAGELSYETTARKVLEIARHAVGAAA